MWSVAVVVKKTCVPCVRRLRQGLRLLRVSGCRQMEHGYITHRYRAYGVPAKAEVVVIRS
jgi:hypothetical protein